MNANARIRAISICPLTDITYRDWLIGQAVAAGGIFSTPAARAGHAVAVADAVIASMAETVPPAIADAQGDAMLDLEAVDRPHPDDIEF